MTAWLSSSDRDDHLVIAAGGAWTLPALADLDQQREAFLVGVARAGGPGSGAPAAARIDLSELERLDTAGAGLIHQLEQDLDDRGWQVAIGGAGDRHAVLLEVVRQAHAAPAPPDPRINPFVRLLALLGRNTVEALEESQRLLSFYGQTVVACGRLVIQPHRLRLTSLTHHLEQTCINALPIVGLIAFLIGVVMAYQGADQLRRFGAEIFTVDLLGVSILREIGILLTAIVVAGRSGSSFTAELGLMKVNQEVDALRTLGLDPIEVLVLPRLFALMLALPLLAFFADIMALAGGGLMCAFVLDIPLSQYVNQLADAITPATFWTGMSKAPVFAFLIALVGCYEGLSVAASADSVGRKTTLAVVVAIFLVIVFDAIFSILFSYLGL